MNEVINSCLTAFNSIGRGFCGYATGVFVQSSVLIVLLLIIDFLLRRRVRAVFRYCVWMLVFVKLILPPTLSLPTGIGYWYGDYLSTDSPVLQQVSNVVRPEHTGALAPEDFALAAEIPQDQPSLANPEIAAPVTSAVSGLNALTWQAVVFLLWLVGVLVISVLLVQRMLFVKGLIAQSEPAKNRLPDMLNQCRWQVGIRRNIELRLSNSISSPAVCGLFKPVILIPAALLEKLSPDRLRAVLIHELVHIKRADIWVNLVQTVLQIIYFYNPFVWLANAVVRRIREQAVDEMVLVSLGAGAKSYSNTLIDIAEMAFWKTSLSLRLIGVVESKKALHRRIRHMLNRPIPKNARVGVLGTIVIIVIAAIFLPMAKAKKLNKDDTSVSSEHEKKSIKSLHQAAAEGDIEQVKLLISKGTDVNAQNEKGWTPLHSAAWYGLKDVAEVLLAKGANVNTTDVSGETPLHMAANFGSRYVPELLIAKGANVNARDKIGNTPLHHAAGEWHVNKDLLELLLDKGAEVNARNDKGETPLHFAAPWVRYRQRRDLAASTLST